MENSLGSRLKNAWNAFRNNRDPTYRTYEYGASYGYRPDRTRFSRGNERTIATSVLNKIAIDASKITIKHCKLDKDGRYADDMISGLNSCLNLEANIDQAGRSFLQDVYMSAMDEGVVAIVPVDTDVNPENTDSYDILTLRTGKVVAWYPEHVKVNLYNDREGKKDDLILPKRKIGLVENPFYAVMNEPNSTMQRLIRKLNILDAIDEQSGSGKLDMIIQMPYSVRGETQRDRAEKRRADLEKQLTNSKYGIGYIDSTEHITQLNRPLENNLMKQIEYLQTTFYGQLGITQTIMDGTADEKTMLNYYDRSIEPLVSAVVDELKRKFLTKTARTQGQTIMYFRDPFTLVPAGDLAEIADKFTRNEIMTKNEFRSEMGFKPSNDPKADMLINSNISQSNETLKEIKPQTEESEEGGKDQNGQV